MIVTLETNSDDGEEGNGNANDDSAYASHRPSSSGQNQDQDILASELADLNLNSKASTPSTLPGQRTGSVPPDASLPRNASPFGPVRTSLSLLEMLIRLTALQQFQQASHLAIPDELLTFFLEESSTTGGK
jgi:hypothetical protein